MTSAVKMQTGDGRIRTNPGEFGRNRTNRAKRAKLGETGRNRAKKWQMKPNPGKTGRNRKFCRILVQVRASLVSTPGFCLRCSAQESADGRDTLRESQSE